MGQRVYTQRETRLLSEWLALNRAGGRIIRNPRLGSAPIRSGPTIAPLTAGQIQTQAMMYADAVVIYPDRAELYEGKIVLDGRAIGQLLEYRLAVPSSTDIIDFARLPLTLHIVAATARATAMALASQTGIKVHLYTPQWVVDMWSSWYGSQSAPIQPASASITGS